MHPFVEVWPLRKPQNNQIKETVNTCLLTEQLGVSARVSPMSCPAKVKFLPGVESWTYDSSTHSKRRTAIYLPILSIFLVWVRCLGTWWLYEFGGYSFFSPCVSSSNRITANCWPRRSLLHSLGWRSDSDLILSLSSDVCILLDPPGPWSLQLSTLAVFLYCSAPRDMFCWA